MNNDRRKRIRAIVAQLEKLVLPDLDLESLRDDVDGIKNEEQEAYDNMPESLQNGDRGQAASEAVDALEEAEGGLQELMDAFEKVEEIVSKLEEAADAGA